MLVIDQLWVVFGRISLLVMEGAVSEGQKRKTGALNCRRVGAGGGGGAIGDVFVELAKQEEEEKKM